MAGDVGYAKELLVLPFDHRGSFQEKMFGIKGRAPTAEETKLIASYKDVVYDGFKRSLDLGVPRGTAGILVDEQFGDAILRDAKKIGIPFAMCVEKSGQDEFDFDYGAEYGAHIEKYQPTLVKVLVRYNPEGEAAMNARQTKRLKELSDYCHRKGFKFMFEQLVPATPGQMQKVGGDKARYDLEVRPGLMVRSIQDLQKAGIEADVWKLEGLEKAEDMKKVCDAARAGGREKVGIIVLGRGESAEKVREWLKVGAKIPGVIGFAVGRTVFWDALAGFRDKKHDRKGAVELIANNYKGLVDLWFQHRK